VLGGIAGLVAVGGLVAWRALRDTATEVDVESVVESFRAATSAPTTPTKATSATPVAPTTAPPALPAPGVYVYATTGGEEVDALGGTSHHYPAETTITVRPAGCGVALLWIALEERSEEWELCAGEDGALYTTWYKAYHRFFGQEDRRRYDCPEGAAILRPATAGTRWQATCTSGELTEVTRTEVVGREPLVVGARAVDSVHLALDVELHGDDGTTGTAEADLWLHAQTGLPLRRVERVSTTSPQVVGDVHYEERYELVLTSLDPRR
jgi:hypothetical protein